MKITIIALFTFISFNYSFSQSVTLSGHIIDKETNKALPFATIEIFSLKFGTVADQNGDFKLTVIPINENLDTLVFSYLGYKNTKISIGDFLKLDKKTISIKADPITLNEVVIIPKKYKTVKLGITNKKPQSYQITSVYYNKIGNIIENKKSLPGWVKSISFYIAEEGYPETPFRVRIYDIDKKRNCPGNDILNKNVIVSANKPGWFTVDLTSYNIPFPKDGIFVMMEWINGGEKYYYDKEMPTKNANGEIINETRKFYGQTIGSLLHQSKIVTWGITVGNDWTPWIFNHKGYINAMINAEIAYPID